jgi:hypothetical protein
LAEGVVVEGEDVPVGLDPLFGGEAAATEVGEAPRVTAALRAAVPSVSGVDFVWKLSTPASPATVATVTIGARLIVLVSCCQVSRDLLRF